MHENGVPGDAHQEVVVEQARPTTVERVMLLLTLAFLTCVYLWGARYWIDPFEEGYFAYLASRVAVGDLPYRDFATPYTPAYFFLHGLLFQTFGWSLAAQRVGVIAARIFGAALLYLLARRIAPARYAVLAPLMFLLHDPAPVPWHPHPSWYASGAALASAWAVLRFLDLRRLEWLVLAGALAGVSFAFKQNIGLLALLVSGAFIGLTVSTVSLPFRVPVWARNLDEAPWAHKLASFIGPLAAVGLPLAFAVALRSRLQLEYMLEFVVPLLALNIWLLRRRSIERGGLIGRVAPLAALVIGFGGLTVPWLAGLIAAAGRSQTPLRQFVGGVDPEGYILDQWWPHPEGLVILALAPTIVLVWRAWHGRRYLPGLGLLMAWVLLAAAAWSLVINPHESPHRAMASALTQLTENLNQVLPAIAIWICVFGLARGWAPREAVLPVAWLVSFGAAMFFHQYPRMDEPHLIFSAPPVAIGAAWALGVVDARLVAGSSRIPGWAGRAVLTAALLAVPLLSTWPVTNWRWTSLVMDRSERFLPGPVDYAPIEVSRAGVMARPYVAEPLTSLTRAIQERTSPGEPIFAFPGVPMAYYLADRPNATRFNHFLPGLVSLDEEAEAIRNLDERHVRLVVLEPGFEAWWLRESDYRAVRDTIANEFRFDVEAGPYEIWLRR